MLTKSDKIEAYIYCLLCYYAYRDYAAVCVDLGDWLKMKRITKDVSVKSTPEWMDNFEWINDIEIKPFFPEWYLQKIHRNTPDHYSVWWYSGSPKRKQAIIRTWEYLYNLPD